MRVVGLANRRFSVARPRVGENAANASEQIDEVECLSEERFSGIEKTRWRNVDLHRASPKNVPSMQMCTSTLALKPQ